MAAEMAVCSAYGISRSHFLGGPPRWSQVDRDLAIWWHVREAERCGSCGTRKPEWFDDDGKQIVAYRAVPTRCPGCESKERAEASIKSSDGKGVRVEMQRLG